MEKHEYIKNAYDMIYLTTCALKGETPDKARVEEMDLSALYEVCQMHILTACVAYALEKAGVQDHEFTQAKEKAIRKNILMDADRAKILKRLEAEKIWYMPLKGALLKDWYPKLGMRQMSDNDILCDGTKRERIRDIMLELGFTCEHFGKGNDDAYFRQPVCRFEMHNELFHAGQIGNLHKYYDDVKTRLIKDEDSEYGYHFRMEDFYLYITAHEYKHFAGSGTGVRTLVDTYVFLHKFGDSLDQEYLSSELSKLGIADYEKKNRELAMKVFTQEQLTDEEKKLLDYYILSGIYGTVEFNIENSMERNGQGSKLRFVLHRLFPPMERIKVFWPFFYKHKWLIPVLWIYRPFRGLIRNRKRVKAQVDALMKK